MAKVCELCGKGTVAGHRKQHGRGSQWRYRAPKSKRNFKPNLRMVRVEKDGRMQKLKICMKCYKRIRKNQSEE